MKTKEEIFKSLIASDLGMLRAGAYRVLKDPNEADDAVQEALIAAWKKFDQFKGKSKLSTWVFQIMMNICFDRLRAAKRKSEKLQKLGTEIRKRHSEPPDPRIDLMTEAVHELSDPWKASLLLVFFRGMDSAEAAAELGFAVEKFYQIIHKAKQLLREKRQVAI